VGVKDAVRDRLKPMTVSRLARQVARERLTYLSWRKLRSLELACREVASVPGAVVECGIALGGSGILLARTLSDRPYEGYDVFEMIPPPGEHDGPDSHSRYATISAGISQGLGGDAYYGYMPDLYDRVERSFRRFGVAPGSRVRLHKGLFEDTLELEEPVALAHVDCDWYDPVKLCLERIHPWLSDGGLIVLDDYFDYTGCRKATDEFLAAHGDLRVVRDAGHRVLQKRRS
jgi:asparagine synthase (glutamine-hydrolysing)